MYLRARPEKRIKIFDDLRKIAPLDFKLQTELVEDIFYISSTPEWCNKNYTRGAVYYNPFIPACSCDSFLIRHANYKKGDVRIICTHLYEFYRSRLRTDEMQLEILMSKVSLSNAEIIFSKCQLSGDDFFWIGYNLSSPWIHLIIKNDIWTEQLYNLKEKRWAYNLAPVSRAKLEEIIALNFKEAA